jgi:hypothetical protein
VTNKKYKTTGKHCTVQKIKMKKTYLLYKIQNKSFSVSKEFVKSPNICISCNHIHRVLLDEEEPKDMLHSSSNNIEFQPVLRIQATFVRIRIRLFKLARPDPDLRFRSHFWAKNFLLGKVCKYFI